MKDRKYQIELEVVTPLCVGAGGDNDWMPGIDYVQKDGRIYVLDIRKAAAVGIDTGRLANLFEQSDEKGIALLIGNRLEEVSRLVFPAPAATSNPIKTFLRTQLYGRPVVAGSSIKGAVRSALFHHLREHGETTNEAVFGTMKDGTDFMRFIRIADVEMPATALVNTKIFNLQRAGETTTGGWKHAMSETNSHYRPTGFNTLYECVLPGSRGVCSIALAGKAFELMAADPTRRVAYADKKRQLLNGDIRGLFHIVNEVTRTYLIKEKAFFEKYTAERSAELTDNIDALLAKIPADDSGCLMKMSAGVGFHAITGDWQYDDYSQTGYWEKGRNAGKKKYKSRKTADYGGHLQLMGFVLLRLLTAAEAANRAQALDAEHGRIIETIVAPAREREAARQRQQVEERLRRLAVEEEQRRQAALRKLLEEAAQLYADGHWDEAQAKAEEAAAVCPESKEAADMVERCRMAKEIETYRRGEEEKAMKRLAQPLVAVISGKTSAGNLIGTAVKWAKGEGNTFGEAELQALLAEARKLPQKEQKKLKGKGAELSKTIGPELAQRFFAEMG